MKAGLKVLSMPSWYIQKTNPNSGIFFKEQAEGLNEFIDIAVFSIDLISLKNIKQIITEDKKQIYNNNGVLTFNYNYINWFPKLKTLKTKLYKKRVIDSFQEILNKFGKPDLIHAHVSYPAGYGAMILSQKYNIPFMVTEHASFFEEVLMDDYKYYTTQVLKKADMYTAVSTFLKSKILNAGRKQCLVVPNFVDIKRFTTLSRSTNWEYADKFNLLNVSGIMRRIKGIKVLLKALEKIIHNYGYRNICLHLIGKDKKDKYKKIVKRLNIDNHCIFYGQVSNREVAKHMNLCDSLVISSKRETFGLVGIEAMATGTPIITTRCGGPQDYIESWNGILVDKENVNQMANGILKMKDNYNNFDNKKIKQYVKKNYSQKNVCKKLINIYKKIKGV